MSIIIMQLLTYLIIISLAVIPPCLLWRLRCENLPIWTLVSLVCDKLLLCLDPYLAHGLFIMQTAELAFVMYIFIYLPRKLASDHTPH